MEEKGEKRIKLFGPSAGRDALEKQVLDWIKTAGIKDWEADHSITYNSVNNPCYVTTSIMVTYRVPG